MENYILKIGIITLVSDNYGNKYQNYAVEQLLSKYGEVETFRLEELYQIPSVAEKSFWKKLNPLYIKEVLISRLMYKFDLNQIAFGILHNYIYVKRHKQELIQLRNKRSERFHMFSDKYLHISEKKLNYDNATQEWADKFRWFICGSDQIWNPTYATTSKLAFCSFATEKTICFSPSFGVSEVPDYRKEEYSRWLKSIRELSVREEAGQKIIKELTGRNAVLLLDPTMILPKEKWEEIAHKPEAELPNRYIVVYFLGRVDKSYKNQIEKIAKEKALPLVTLFNVLTPEYYIMDPSEVLYTILHADYIITDSFHGTVFSILFHKNFTILSRKESGANMNSRIDTLVKKFNLEDRIDLGQLNIIDQQQWNKIDEILYEERIKAIKYLNSAFKK